MEKYEYTRQIVTAAAVVTALIVIGAGHASPVAYTAMILLLGIALATVGKFSPTTAHARHTAGGNR